MVANGKRNAGEKVQAELVTLAEELAKNLQTQKQLAAREQEIKDRIAALTEQYALPFQAGASEYLNLATIGKALQVTRPTPTVKIGDPEEFRRRLGCDNFHKVCEISTVRFRDDAWTLLVSEERVKESDLDGVVTVGKQQTRISFSKLHDDDDGESA